MLGQVVIKRSGKYRDKPKPVHSLLFVKSIPTMRLEDSSPAWARASVTCGGGTFQISDEIEWKFGILRRY